MMYVLILLICVYVLLATTALVQAPRRLSSVALAVYLASVSLVTTSFIILGTTQSRALAESAAVFAVFIGGWLYAAMLPLTILSLYWPAWVARHWRPLAGLLMAILLLEIVFIVAIHPAGEPWVYQLDDHHWAHWMLHLRAISPAGASLTGFGNLSLAVLAIGWVWYHKRLTFWRGAVALTVAVALSILMLALAPLGGARGMLVIAALSYLPPALLLAAMVLRAGRALPLESLIAATLQTASDYLILLDAHRQVLWHNLHAAAWIDAPPQTSPDALNLTALLAGSPVEPIISRMLADGLDSQTGEITHAGEDVALHVSVHPLPATPRHLARTQILVRDVSAARVRRDLQARNHELTTLSAISVTIASLLDENQVVSQSLQAISEIISAGGLLVYLRDARHAPLVRLAGTCGFIPEVVPSQFSLDDLDGDSLMHHALGGPETVIITPGDQTADADQLAMYGVRGGVFVPLITTGAPLGVLVAAGGDETLFSPLEITLLESIARQMAVAIENARLHAQEREQRRVADVLRQVVGTLSSPSLDQALDRILALLHEVVDYQSATVLIKAEPGTLRLGAYAGLTDVAPAQLSQTRVIIADFHYLGRLFEERAPQLVADTTTDPHWTPRAYDASSWMGAPLIGHDDLLGCLSISHHTAGHFTPDDLQTATTFAAQVSIVIENAHLLRETRRQNRALSALNTVLAASNEALTHENMLSVMLARVLETLELPAGLIHQYRAAAQELHLRAAHGLPDAALDAYRILPVTLSLPDHGAPQVALMPQDLPGATLPDGETIIFTSVPLVAHGVGIGLLSIAHPDSVPPSAELDELLARIGQQLGVVMDNATLFETTTRRVTLSTDLGRLSLALSTQLDRAAVLHLVCRESVSIFDVQGAYIWLVEGDHLVGQVAYGPEADRFIGHQIDRGDHDLVMNYVLDEWRPHIINHARHTPALPADFLQMTGARSVLAVPLLRADVPLGTLLLVNTEQTNAFAGWLLEQIGLLGVQAALAIQNATLFDAVRRRLDQLRLVNETGRYTTAILSPQELIEGIAHKLSEALHYDSVGLLQVEEHMLAIQSVFTGGAMRPVADLPSLEPTLIALASDSIHQAEPVLGEIATVPPSNALCIPLIVADEVIGVLFVARVPPQAITAEDLDVLEPLATQLAISVSNARLFEKVRQQAVELEARVAQRTREIRQQHERTEAILRSVADAVIVFDLQGQVVMTNPTARQLFDEHDLDMDLGKRVGDLVARALDTLTNSSSATDTIELRGTVLQANAARVVEGERTLGSVVVLRDISQLSHLDRMKDLFVSNVSHELRTPLANLKLYLSLLEQGREDRRAGYLAVMHREIQRLTRLIDDLLQISRLQSEGRDERPQTRQPVQLRTLIDSVVQQNIARADAEHKELRCAHQSGPLPSLRGDPDQLIRAITNLVSNAINYTPEGGYIAVRSRVTQTNPEWVIIEVADTGIGIPADDLPHIFDRFHRGANVGSDTPGTGLGLAIIKEIVELHHGKIEVESEAGQGSTFRVWLPVGPHRGEE